jgi:hypothetical protein
VVAALLTQAVADREPGLSSPDDERVDTFRHRDFLERYTANDSSLRSGRSYLGWVVPARPVLREFEAGRRREPAIAEWRAAKTEVESPGEPHVSDLRLCGADVGEARPHSPDWRDELPENRGHHHREASCSRIRGKDIVARHLIQGASV